VRRPLAILVRRRSCLVSQDLVQRESEVLLCALAQRNDDCCHRVDSKNNPRPLLFTDSSRDVALVSIHGVLCFRFMESQGSFHVRTQDLRTADELKLSKEKKRCRWVWHQTEFLFHHSHSNEITGYHLVLHLSPVQRTWFQLFFFKLSKVSLPESFRNVHTRYFF
jgi:hypothetical protein